MRTSHPAQGLGNVISEQHSQVVAPLWKGSTHVGGQVAVFQNDDFLLKISSDSKLKFVVSSSLLKAHYYCYDEYHLFGV